MTQSQEIAPLPVPQRWRIEELPDMESLSVRALFGLWKLLHAECNYRNQLQPEMNYEVIGDAYESAYADIISVMTRTKATTGFEVALKMDVFEDNTENLVPDDEDLALLCSARFDVVLLEPAIPRGD